MNILNGKCRELSIAACKENPDLMLVQGYYDCPGRGRQPHWWAKDNNGVIHDPTANQFMPLGDYIEVPFPSGFGCNLPKDLMEVKLSCERNF